MATLGLLRRILFARDHAMVGLARRTRVRRTSMQLLLGAFVVAVATLLLWVANTTFERIVFVYIFLLLAVQPWMIFFFLPPTIADRERMEEVVLTGLTREEILIGLTARPVRVAALAAVPFVLLLVGLLIAQDSPGLGSVDEIAMLLTFGVLVSAFAFVSITVHLRYWQSHPNHPIRNLVAIVELAWWTFIGIVTLLSGTLLLRPMGAIRRMRLDDPGTLFWISFAGLAAVPVIMMMLLFRWRMTARRRVTLIALLAVSIPVGLYNLRLQYGGPSYAFDLESLPYAGWLILMACVCGFLAWRRWRWCAEERLLSTVLPEDYARACWLAPRALHLQAMPHAAKHAATRQTTAVVLRAIPLLALSLTGLLLFCGLFGAVSTPPPQYVQPWSTPMGFQRAIMSITASGMLMLAAPAVFLLIVARHFPAGRIPPAGLTTESTGNLYTIVPVSIAALHPLLYGIWYLFQNKPGPLDIIVPLIPVVALFAVGIGGARIVVQELLSHPRTARAIAWIAIPTALHIFLVANPHTWSTQEIYIYTFNNRAVAVLLFAALAFAFYILARFHQSGDAYHREIQEQHVPAADHNVS